MVDVPPKTNTDKFIWWKLIPDLRTLVVLGYFVLSYKLISMIEHNAMLLANAAFMTIVTLVIGTGGLGAIAMFFFGGTKTGSDVMTAQSNAVIASSPPPGAHVQ